MNNQIMPESSFYPDVENAPPLSGPANFFLENQEQWNEWKREKEREKEEARFNFNEYQRYVGDVGRANLVKAEQAK